MGFSGFCIRVLRGAMCRGATGRGRRCMDVSVGGGKRGSGNGCCGRCRRSWTPTGRLTGMSGLWTAVRCGQAEQPPGGKKEDGEFARRTRKRIRIADSRDGEPDDHALGRSRGGFGSKVHLVCDGHGLALHVLVSAGQRHESLFFEQLMDRVTIRRPRGRSGKRPRQVVGDKGYDCPRIRTWLRAHRIKAVIPQKKTRYPRTGRPCAFDRAAYRRRNAIERCVGWLKEYRRVGTRYEKLAVNFPNMIILAIVDRYLKGYS